MRAPLLVATDLDGTLLDERDYGHAPAAEALRELRELRVPLVLASSKTRAEMEALAPRLGLECALVVENGGALVVPRSWLAACPRQAAREAHAYVLRLGLPRDRLAEQLDTVALEAGLALEGFAALGPTEVARLTGLDPETARLACRRSFDEPFLVAGRAPGDAPEELQGRLRAAARRHGLQVSSGGRFWHLTGDHDKGSALSVLLGLLAAEGRRFATVGLGDAPGDLSFLSLVDRPIVMPRQGRGPDPELAAALRGAELAPAPGPAGWNAAVLAALRGAPLARLDGDPEKRR